MVVRKLAEMWTGRYSSTLVLLALHPKSTCLEASVLAGLVDVGGIEGDDFAVGGRHGRRLDLGVTRLPRADLLRTRDFLKFRHRDGGEESEDSNGELHVD